jgi:primosomal protein N' (replication factor Y)
LSKGVSLSDQAPVVDPNLSTYFVDAILPLPIPKLFTYRVPRELNDELHVGSRIVVPFGKTKILTGIIYAVHEHPPKDYEARYIVDILDTDPTLNATQLKFYRWMANYYMCTLGEVLQAALPSGLKIDTTSLVQRNPYFEAEQHVLSIEEQLVMEQLAEDSAVESAQLADLVGHKNIAKVLRILVAKEAILVIDHVREKFTPKTKKFLRLTAEVADSESKLEEIVNQLEKKPKQLEVVLAYLREVPLLENPSANDDGMAKEEILLAGVSASSIQTLVKNQVFEQFNKEISRFEKITTSKREIELEPEQVQAKTALLEWFAEKDIALLHGITGSGKTEIYIDLIRESINNGHQVLYILPEIALTSQIVSRLKHVFGNEMGVYHSKYSANERVEVWQGLAKGEINLIVGVRSSVFLPFADLGLVIIDEEHEPSFKQFDPAPRYHARDSALMLANMHGAKSILGTATPSMESYYLAEKGHYGYVRLDKRYGESQLPVIKTIDLARAKKTKKIKGNFSDELITAIQNALNDDQQVIVFQNRRGYAPFLSCDTCSWVPQCPHCDVSLTYHQYNSELRCHYCGYKTPMLSTCSACGSHNLKTVSFGTEQLEEEIRTYIPDIAVARLDFDTTKGKTSHQRIIDDFDSGKTRILVGTQMVAKGLDFANVGLVAIIDLDKMLHFPDFRSVERTFQLAIQVAGRAGRSKLKGQVLIQTYNPDQAVIYPILHQKYEDFYRTEIEERRLFNYPPYTRLIKLTIRDRENQLAAAASAKLYQLLIDMLGETMLLGPVIPVISKIRDRYLREIFLKIGRQKDIAGIKKTVAKCIHELHSEKDFKKTDIIIDVDPI